MGRILPVIQPIQEMVHTVCSSSQYNLLPYPVPAHTLFYAIQANFNQFPIGSSPLRRPESWLHSSGRLSDIRYSIPRKIPVILDLHAPFWQSQIRWQTFPDARRLPLAFFCVWLPWDMPPFAQWHQRRRRMWGSPSLLDPWSICFLRYEKGGLLSAKMAGIRTRISVEFGKNWSKSRIRKTKLRHMGPCPPKSE